MATLLEKVGSRYLLVNAVARRAREISEDAEELRQTLDRKAVTIAIEEIANDKYVVKSAASLY
jgi:DNA-directed RNA polymerase subunit omega